jgi:hypothetical protein
MLVKKLFLVSFEKIYRGVVAFLLHKPSKGLLSDNLREKI